MFQKDNKPNVTSNTDSLSSVYVSKSFIAIFDSSSYINDLVPFWLYLSVLLCFAPLLSILRTFCAGMEVELARDPGIGTAKMGLIDNTKWNFLTSCK